MTGIRQFPLGHSITGSVHSVCVSLPTMKDVIGYEERDPRVRNALETGYPRFVEHPLCARLSTALTQRLGTGDAVVTALADDRCAGELIRYVGKGTRVVEAWPGLCAAVVPGNDSEQGERLRHFLQHTGVAVSSRRAERHLAEMGVAGGRFQEQRVTTPREVLEDELRLLFGWPRAVRPILCQGGMNAFFGVYRGVMEWQRPKGRNRWMRLGWLYVDTIRILERFLFPGADPIVIHDVHDWEAIETAFRVYGSRMAGVVTEAPTNPLVETIDLPRLSDLARRHGVTLVLDPSLTGPYNVDLLPYADVVVSSLTKYVAHGADVLAGCVALNPSWEGADQLKDYLGQAVTPLDADDLARLGWQLPRVGEVSDRINSNVREVAAWLERDPRVTKVRWAGQETDHMAYERLRRPQGGPGAIITFDLGGDLVRFYDTIRLAKTPSFGAEFSMLCPFLYLAHYDMVTSQAGRRRLDELGMNPELVRLSVGTEDPQALIAVLDEALSA